MDEELVNTLRSFGKAYPEDVFAPLGKNEIAAVVKGYPGFVDRNSAGMGRHCAKFMERAADAIERLSIGATRYEIIRKLNVAQFAELYKKNLSAGVPFDQLIDELGMALSEPDDQYQALARTQISALTLLKSGKADFCNLLRVGATGITVEWLVKNGLAIEDLSGPEKVLQITEAGLAALDAGCIQAGH